MGARFWAAVLLALTAPVAARAASYNVNLPCAPVHHLIARNGKVMLVACVNRKTGFKIDFLDLPSGHVLRSIAPGDNIDGVALSNDGRRLAIGWSSGRISVFSTRDKNVDTFKAAPDPEALNFLGDDRLIVASTLWDVSGKRPLHAFKTDFGPVNVVARSADGTQLATGGGDTVVRLYNAHSWKLTHRFTGLSYEPFALAFVKGGKELAVTGGDDRIVLLDTATGRAVKTLPKSGPAGAFIGDLQTAGKKGWSAVTYVDPRSNKPVGWRFTNLNTGTSEPACEGADALGVSESAVWCFKIKGKTLVANAAAPPNK